MEGYVKIFRKFIKWEWYTKPNMVQLFLHFLLLANHEEGSWRGINIKRGQFITGRNSLSKDTGLSPQSIRSCIKRLKSTNEITTQPTNKFSIITIVNWEEYQKSTNTLTTKITNNQPAINQQLTTNKNVKNDKNVKKESSRNFVAPSLLEVENYCKERKTQISAENFVNFYESKGWLIGKNKMKDWRASVRTWEQREAPKKEEEINIPNYAKKYIQ